jgi:lysozyme
MAFNLGVPKLIGFRNTLADMEAGRYDEAADGMLASLWAKQVGNRADRLADMMRKGV